MIRRFLSRAGIFLAGLALTASLHAQVGPIPGMGPLPFTGGTAACGTPTVTNIGINGSSVGTVTLSGVTVPAGSLIIVAVADETALGSVSDGVNTYTLAANSAFNGGGMHAGLYFAANASLSGGTITYTRTTGTAAEISAVYSSNILTSSPQDAAVTATANGITAAPTVTSGTPGQSGELFVGGLAVNSAAGLTITQDTGHGWAFPPNTGSQSDGSALIFASGGTQVNAGTGTKIFAPTLSASRPWGILVVGFKHC